MRYAAVVTKEGKATLAEFPDCPGCQTFVDGPGEDIAAQAHEALEGWLESRLAAGDAPPQPRKRVAGSVLWVEVPAKLAFKLELRWARLGRHMSQGDLAKLMGVSQPMIAKLEDPDSNLSLETMQKAADALGLHLDVSLLASPN